MFFSRLLKFSVSISLLFIPLFALSKSAIPKLEGWVPIAYTDNNELIYYAKKGTARIEGNTAKMLVQIVQNRAEQKRVDNGPYATVSVSRKDCDAGYGTITFKSLNGVEEPPTPYSSNGRYLSDTIGEFLCLYFIVLK